MGKYKGLLLIVLVLLVLIAGEVVVSQMLAKKKKSQQSQKPVVSQKVLPIDMAKKALDCLETTRDERGAFVLSIECDENSLCQNGSPSNRDGLYVLWGRTKYIEKTNDLKELEILIRDIDLHLDEKKFEVIQPDFVSKMFLYDMWQNKIFSLEGKEKIKALAKRFEVPELAVMGPAYKYARNENYQSPDFTSLIVDKKGNGIIPIIIEDEWKYTQIVSVASDYIIDYQWFKDTFSLKIAESLLSGLIENYNFGNISFLNRNLLGLTAVQFYQATGEKIFLDLAVNIYNHPDIQKPYFFSNSYRTNLIDPTISAIFSDNLFLATKETKYQESKNGMINFLVKFGSDSSGISGKGKGCYYELFPENYNHKITMENGLIVGLLSEVANE